MDIRRVNPHSRRHCDYDACITCAYMQSGGAKQWLENLAALEIEVRHGTSVSFGGIIMCNCIHRVVSIELK